jgi:hypothetical protein
MGATLGVAAMPALGASVVLGPFIGGAVGALVASMAMDVAIEAGIEAPYREVVGNTTALRDSARLLEDVSRAVFQGQVHFSAFLTMDARLDTALRSALADGSVMGAGMAAAIDRI